MIIYSVTTLFMWAIGMVVNHYLGNGNILFTLMTFIPVLLIGLIITKIITTPLIPFFKEMHEGSKETDYIGLKANLLLPISGSRKSQAEVYIEGDIHRITVSLREEDKTTNIKKGTAVYITGISTDKSFYWIAKDDLI